MTWGGRASRGRWIVLLAALLLTSATVPSGAQEGSDKKALEIVQRTIAAYGGEASVYLLRQRGQLRGFVKAYLEDGSTREGEITIRFLHRLEKQDELRQVELRFPNAPTLIITYDGERVWGTENGAPIVLRLRTEAAFRAELKHNYEALLRYREYKAQVKYVGREKRSGIDVDVLDLVRPDGSTTRYFISARTFRILHLEYDVTVPLVNRPIRFRDSFYDFRVVQTTLVPYRTERYEDGRLVQEIRFTEVAYGMQIEESQFRPPGS
ncbi:hypothetical protein HRbin10_00219 [bacterium HR10]|nr:hypothetical protein HRbin10_00219 [bacterium HR10]